MCPDQRKEMPWVQIVILLEIARHFRYTTNMKNQSKVGQSVPLINSYTYIQLGREIYTINVLHKY